MQKISSISNLFCRKIWGSDHTTRSRRCCTTRRLAEAEAGAGDQAWPRLLPSSRGWGSGKQQGRESSVRSFCWRLGICSCFSQFILLPYTYTVVIIFYTKNILENNFYDLTDVNHIFQCSLYYMSKILFSSKHIFISDCCPVPATGVRRWITKCC